ncbi:hypothetical protein V5F79_22105 [Xanthobacter flavus]
MHDDMLKPLEKWVSRQPEKPSLSEAIRTIVRDRLIAEGLIPASDSSKA